MTDWRRELEQIDIELDHDEGSERSWLLHLRRRILRYLVDRYRGAAPPHTAAPWADPGSASRQPSQPLAPPPAVCARIRRQLHDLHTANENRYESVTETTRKELLEHCMTMREHDVRHRLRLMVSPVPHDLIPLASRRRSLTVGDLQRRLSRQTVHACPKCGRIRDRDDERCIACDYRFAADGVTLDDVACALARELRLPRSIVCPERQVRSLIRESCERRQAVA